MYLAFLSFAFYVSNTLAVSDFVSPWFLIVLEVVNKDFGNKLVDFDNVRVLRMCVFVFFLVCIGFSEMESIRVDDKFY